MEQCPTELSPARCADPAQLVAEAFDVGYRRLVVQLFLATGDLAEAEQVVQEAFVRAEAAGTPFADVLDPEAWLRAAAFDRHHARVHRLRRWARERGGRPEAAGERLELVPALRRLPPRQREVLALRELAGLSPTEVARTLHLPARTVESRLRGLPALEQAGALRVEVECLVHPPELTSIERRGRSRRRRRLVRTALVVATVLLAGAGVSQAALDRTPAADPARPGAASGPWAGAASHRWRLSRGRGAPRVQVTLGSGWAGELVLQHAAGDGSVGLLVAEVDGVARAPCSPDGLDLPPVGEDPRDVAASIAAAPGLEERGPVEHVTAFGRFAERLRLRVTEDARCPAGGSLLRTPLGRVVAPPPGTSLDVWVVDVGGRAVVVMGSSSPGAGSEGEALLSGVLSTVVLDVASRH